MAACSSDPSVELNGQPQKVLVDVKWAKKAIAKVARVLRELLAKRERVDVLKQLGLLEKKDVEDVVKALQQKIEESPSLFGVLVRELINSLDGAVVAKKLQDLYTDNQLKNLREELHKINAENKPEAKELIKKTFISNCLHMSIDACNILEALKNLHTKDKLIGVDVYQWCKTQLENREKSVQPPTVSEVNFCKEVVQNSIVACHLLEQEDVSIECCLHENSLFEGNRSIGLQPDEETATAQREGPVSQYLITSAEGTTNPGDCVIYYIAFSSHQSLREWSDNYKSFEEGLMKQQNQLPIQFIMDMLWKGSSVVLTGFSFGGNLAQFCAVQLCTLSQSICPELLEKNLLCVTFGQPIISQSLPDIVDGKLDKSRFHAIYITDDVVPRVLRCLDPTFSESAVSKSEMAEKIKSQINSQELFQNSLSTFAMNQLIMLQEYENEYVLVEDVAHTQSVGHEELHGQHSSENSSNPTAKSGHKSSDNQVQELKDAIQELRSLLRLLKQQESPGVPLYVTYWKLGAGKLQECKTRDLAFPADTAIRYKDLFSKHKIDHYYNMIKKEYTTKESMVKFEEAGALARSVFDEPSVTKVEIHHFIHNETAALALEGDNLYFTFKVKLHLNISKKDIETVVAEEKSVSRRCIVIQKISVPLPSEFAESSDNGASNVYQECKETAKVCLFTRFGEFQCKNMVEVWHKKFYISPRRQQMADLPVTQVIELSFLGALLERHPHSSSHLTSKRYIIIQEVLQQIVEVVPIESVFSCIANTSSDQEACLICDMLELAKVKPLLSLSFFVNAGLAIMKLLGDSVDFQHSTTVEDLFYVIFVAAKKLALPIILWWKTPEPESRHLRWFGPDVATNCHNSNSVKYLQTIVEDAIKDSNKEIPAVSNDSIASLFEATRKLEDREDTLAIKSPWSILSDGQTELQNLQSRVRGELNSHLSTELEAESNMAATVNTMLLDFVKKIRNGDLRTCIQIITAFMEEQVHIPVSNFHLSVSIWKLWKLGLIFRKKVSKDFVTHYYISESKHIENVTSLTDHTASSVAAKSSLAANSKYVGKLHFLLLASSHQNEPPPVIDEHLTLSSLEDNLSARFAQATEPIDESTPLEDIERKWDTLFGDVGMSTVVHTHRRLVAQWLKFSLLIRKLRENLSCHTTVSIIGLVNSGKSTLVKELFRIDDVETGTRSKKRTTVPFLYSIPGVENFDVIDFPAVDDQNEHIKDLVKLLRTLSQLVVFVVNYSDAHTTKAVQWYKELNKNALPHLICLTHGDRLYAESKRRCEKNLHKDATPNDIKIAIQKEVKASQDTIQENIKEASQSSMLCVKIVSLKMDNDSPLKTPDGLKSIRDAGIKGVEDVGGWIVKSIKQDLREAKTAQMLEHYLKLPTSL